jgi:hypothetical protein
MLIQSAARLRSSALRQGSRKFFSGPAKNCATVEGFAASRAAAKASSGKPPQFAKQSGLSAMQNNHNA